MNHLEKLRQLVNASVTPYHCILESIGRLQEAGFRELPLARPWELEKGGAYYINAYDSTLVAFTVGKAWEGTPRLRLAASHTDWPCFKLKPSAETRQGRYGRLNVEVYGGPIYSTWLDRPLSLAGKVCTAVKGSFYPGVTFVDFRRPLLTIPNLAIHMNRDVNKGVSLNPQTDLLPLLALLEENLGDEEYFLEMLAEELKVKKEEILDYEIYVYNAEEGTLLGKHEEFYSSPRLDNLTSVEACLCGIIGSRRETGIHAAALFDNEEIGNRTKQGAASSLLDRLLEKIYLSLGYGRAEYLDGLLDGFLLSLDVAHAIHPNHPEKCDITNQITLGDGVALKLSASQSYATDARYASAIENLCRVKQIPYKKFINRSDIKGGSTLGSASSCNLSMPAVDAGITLLAMHSARELMCAKDQEALDALVEAYFNA